MDSFCLFSCPIWSRAGKIFLRADARGLCERFSILKIPGPSPEIPQSNIFHIWFQLGNEKREKQATNQSGLLWRLFSFTQEDWQNYNLQQNPFIARGGGQNLQRTSSKGDSSFQNPMDILPVFCFSFGFVLVLLGRRVLMNRLKERNQWTSCWPMCNL